ncbi:UDP-2,3-diacylglucosamine diphosphatase [uncultured Tolumonas sp.]|uniref:UDP-2,3-diacylglucosamine diphosphatase n=1 Tax=uncultured Tolumonas sp. TaxID=263765 RepID=UPI002A0A5C0B|nr:UDP-2,3-diacylglucosamine diphosphatase [uncultured Tolumonas sp.]
MTKLFIADLHLSEARPDLTNAFIHFLATKATQADELYILGDLFEFWIGDDEQSPLQQQITHALKTLSEQGCRLFYSHGNRDFMIGKRFARECGMTLLPPIYPCEMAGERTLLLHGDQLCTDDEAYQRFRRITSWPWLQWVFLHLPLSRRVKIAQQIRQGSHKGKQQKSRSIMDVTPGSVNDCFEQHQATLMIHGHTHRPMIHELSLNNGQKVRRIVLGDWNTDLWYLQIDDRDINLISQPITSAE